MSPRLRLPLEGSVATPVADGARRASDGRGEVASAPIGTRIPGGSQCAPSTRRADARTMHFHDNEAWDSDVLHGMDRINTFDYLRGREAVLLRPRNRISR